MIIVPKEKWAYPIAYEKTYTRTIRSYVARLTEICQECIPDMKTIMKRQGARLDDYSQDMDNLLNRIGSKLDKRVAEKALRRKIVQTYGLVDGFNQEEFQRIVHHAVGIKNFHTDEKWQKVAQAVWVQENIDLIKSIDRQYLEKIRYKLGDMIMKAQDNSVTSSELSGMIQEIAHNQRNRADLIARDQIGKLNGRLTQFRQQEAGIKQYIWRTSRDERVRSSHRERDGKTYDWDNPPPDGHPGMPIRCRCVAIPVIDTETFGKVEQQKHKRKIPVNDIAIKKVPRIKPKGMTEAEADELQEAVKEVLRIAKEENEHNEVMIMYNQYKKEPLNDKRIVIKGTRNKVDMDTIEYRIMQREAYEKEIISIHNHPAGSTYSVADVAVFITDNKIGIMSVVSNLGNARLIWKTDKYDEDKAYELLEEIVVIEEEYGYNVAVEELLDRLGEVGIGYAYR